MYGWIVKLIARPDKKDELLDFLRWDAGVARDHEPGTVRFDVWEDDGEPNTVILYEAYIDETAFEAHQAGEPFKHFVDHIVPNVIEQPIFLVRPGHTDLTNISDALPGAS